MQLLQTFNTSSVNGNTPLGLLQVSQTTFTAAQLAAMYLDKPEFLVSGASVANVTGDGTAYPLVFGTETLDIGANFASNAFTVPKTARYFLGVNLTGAGITGMTLFKLELFVNGVTACKLEECVAANYGSSEFAIQRSAVLNLTAADVVTVVWTVTGGSKVADLTSSQFYGRLWSM